MISTALETKLSLALLWLDDLVRLRLAKPQATELLPPTALLPGDDAFTRLVRDFEPTYAEFVVLLLALAPHVAPGRLDAAIGASLTEGANLPEAGGARGTHHRGLLPTAETALWLLGGTDLDARARLQSLFGAEHWFATRCVLELEPVRHGEPLLSGRLILDADLVELLVHGRISAPKFGRDFPAQHLTTELDWDDLVLHPATRSQIRDIQNWVTY